MSASAALAAGALTVLRQNDAGLFFRPGPRLYPFQWNWDSALIALGLAHVDPGRARREVHSLLRGQWADGMVPHIVFHGAARDYSPGPEVWASKRCAHSPEVPTSGITQPPVLATAVRALHEVHPDREFLERVLPAMESWHRWLHRERALDGSGLVAIVHPWEAADNSPRFDRALARLDEEDAAEVARVDRQHADARERPTNRDYRRYLLIVERLRACGYRPASVRDAPFVYADLSFNSVLAVAEDDLGWLWREVGGDAERATAAAERLRQALGQRWDAAAAAYGTLDGAGATETVDDLFPLYAGVPDAQQARRLFVEALWSAERFGPSREAPWAVTSVSKSSPAFDPVRYWRGPVWININWFLVRGLQRLGMHAEAERLRSLTLQLVDRFGFSEYYHPSSGRPLGSDSFSWSAALTLDLLRRPS
jgi:mannosylglycerate hydrolase